MRALSSEAPAGASNSLPSMVSLTGGPKASSPGVRLASHQMGWWAPGAGLEAQGESLDMTTLLRVLEVKHLLFATVSALPGINTTGATDSNDATLTSKGKTQLSGRGAQHLICGPMRPPGPVWLLRSRAQGPRRARRQTASKS